MDPLAVASGPGGQMMEQPSVFQDFRKMTKIMLKQGEQLYLSTTFIDKHVSLLRTKKKPSPEVNHSVMSPAEPSRLKRYGGRIGGVFNGAVVAKYMPFGQYGLGSAKYLSKSTQLVIIDYSQKVGGKFRWVLRIDKPHKGVNFDHINFNPEIFKFKDPHIKLPPGSAALAGALNTTIKYAGDAAFLGAIAWDMYRIGSAVYSEVQEKGRPGIETGREVADVAGTYGAGAVGSVTGTTIGGWVGAGIGSVFGPVGTVSGAAIGSLAGGLGGGIYGALMGRTHGRTVVNAYFCKTTEETSLLSSSPLEEEMTSKSSSEN